MISRNFPQLESAAIAPTRDAVHAYARAAGSWARACRRPRKHWWHASLRPSLRGLTTGVIRASQDFELELDLAGSALRIRTVSTERSEPFAGQSGEQLRNDS